MVFGLKLGLKKSQVDPPREDKQENSQSTKGALTVNEFVARTKRCREKGLEPTKPELIAYARYLGIDPIADGDLMWIADEALNAPLPSEWTEHHDSADRVFYYNVQTHASSWTHPLEQLHRDTYKKIVLFRSGDLSKDDQLKKLEDMQKKCEQAEHEAHKELQLWTEHTDEQGQKFYYNSDQQRSVWTDPRPARCHTLYLQMKALRVMGAHCGQASRFPEEYSKTLLNRDLGLKMPLGGAAKASSRKNDKYSLLEEDDDGPSESDMELVEKERHKRKKKRKEKERMEQEAQQQQQQQPLGGMPSPDALRGGKSNPLDFKKPPLSAVEEVRQALGVSNNGAGGLPPLGRSHLGPASRLNTPPGDGLSNVGRTRVRAGIKLEPLNVN